MKYKTLTPEEKRVIENKGTEPPFSGEYDEFFKPGVYTCKRCGQALYRSEDKFNSGCGWPSFDSEIPGAVIRIIDEDGRRTEITCSNCGAHLGHVFEGEKLTKKDTRHCVNSISMEFIPRENLETGVFAAGCFWGVERDFRKVKGVVDTLVGYTGGTVENPTYEQVSTGKTEHAESVKVWFDPKVTSYEELVREFFGLHDPTTLDRQGVDKGSQYRSVIFYKNDTQKTVAETVIAELKDDGINVKTKLEPAGEFYPAEAYHQRYLEK